MQKTPYDIVVFLVVVSGLIVFMVAFIVFMLYLYRKKQQSFEKDILRIKQDNEKTVLNTQLEIQEQTFQHIAREIHDNISLSLTLAKLQLHTFDWNDQPGSSDKLTSSVELLTKSIAELSDISKGMNADIIIQQGLLRAVEEEIGRIRQTGLFTLDFILTGIPVYMKAQQELIIFRIIQEAFNNIIKHAKPRNVSLQLHYTDNKMHFMIADNGIGFDTEQFPPNRQAGLKNMKTRTKMLGGTMIIVSRPGHGASLNFTIPFENNEQNFNTPVKSSAGR
jgi:two-component system NarL family sensor kinase